MIQLEYQNFMHTLWKLARLKRQDDTKALNEAGKTFTRYAMRFTPPFPARGRDSMALEGAMGNHYAKGKEVVARDIRRVFMPLEEAGIIKSPRNNELAQRINFLAFGKRPAAMPVSKYEAGTLESRVSLSSLLKPSKKLEPSLNKSQAFRSLSERLTALNAIGENLGWPKIIQEAWRIDHQAARGKRGRVSGRLPVSHRRIVLDRKSIDSYIVETWRHLGQAKAGWRLAARALGVSPRDFQQWILQEGALDFVSLGALNHRVDSGIIPFSKATEWQVHPSGGEYNVAANLSNCFRLRTGMVSAMVEYPIGDLIAERVRLMGITPFYKYFKHNGVNGPNMATIYSDRGFGMRAPVVFYNRANEAGAMLKPGAFDWGAIFGAGVRWFHSGGIFASLSETTGELIIEGMQAGKASGAVTSFDVN